MLCFISSRGSSCSSVSREEKLKFRKARNQTVAICHCRSNVDLNHSPALHKSTAHVGFFPDTFFLHFLLSLHNLDLVAHRSQKDYSTEFLFWTIWASPTFQCTVPCWICEQWDYLSFVLPHKIMLIRLHLIKVLHYLCTFDFLNFHVTSL